MARKVKILIFEPGASQQETDKLVKHYKNTGISARFVDPANMRGGYVPPKGIERYTKKNNNYGRHASKVAAAAVRGYTAANEGDGVKLELVIIKAHDFRHSGEFERKAVSKDANFFERIGELTRNTIQHEKDVTRVNNLFKSTRQGKTPFSEEQISEDPFLQQIKAVVDAESKLGPVSGVNFSYAYTSTNSHERDKRGELFSRPSKINNEYFDGLNVLFTKNRGPWGNVLVAIANDNRKLHKRQQSTDSPGLYEDPKSTANRLAKSSSVINIDNEPVAAKDAGKLSHINVDYLGGQSGNSFTSPFILTNFLVEFAKQAHNTFPNQPSAKFTLQMLKSKADTITKVHSLRSGTKATTVGKVFADTLRGDLNRLKADASRVGSGKIGTSSKKPLKEGLINDEDSNELFVKDTSIIPDVLYEVGSALGKALDFVVGEPANPSDDSSMNAKSPTEPANFDSTNL